ncbi:MAG: SUMF1/EgtB/PvdO family nonheme iron enzyme [Chloroflexales bacterium]
MSSFSATALGPESPLFRSRQAELARLVRLCLGEVTAYVVLYGGRQNGKTSLLIRLEAALRPGVAVCRLDFQLIKDASAAHAFAFLADQIARVVPLAPDWREVCDGPTFQTFLSQTLARPEPARLVLLLDELGALPAATREALAHALRSLFHTRLVVPALTKLQILFSGGVELYDLVLTEASSLYNICQDVYLTDLAQPEAVALVADGLRGCGLDGATATAFGAAVYRSAQGHPYFTQKLGGLLEGALHDGAGLGPTSLADAVRQIRQGGDPLLRRIRDDLREYALEDAARRLLSDPPPFNRLDDQMARLELVGLAKPAGEHWAPRNPLLDEVFRARLGLPPAPPSIVSEPVTAPPDVRPKAAPPVEPDGAPMKRARPTQGEVTVGQRQPPTDDAEAPRWIAPAAAPVSALTLELLDAFEDDHRQRALRNRWGILVLAVVVVAVGLFALLMLLGKGVPPVYPLLTITPRTGLGATTVAVTEAIAQATTAPTALPTPTATTPPTALPTLTATAPPTATPPPAWVPALVKVPAGPFLMGSSAADTQALDNEKPQQSVTLDTYWIGKTEVTNAQFRPFVEGDGYTNREYWTAAGWVWQQENKITQPAYWSEAQWNGDTQPVVGVSWFEAVAYCRWLSKQTGHEFRLPSEAEWEKAARGPDGLIWPWGNTWEAGRSNSGEAGLQKTTPVGQYPTGASPYGALDMAGNVWEWGATKWGKPYPYQIEDEWQTAYLEADVNRVLRGGSYYSDQKSVRGAYRSYNGARNRNGNVGLRVASHSLRIDSGS